MESKILSFFLLGLLLALLIGGLAFLHARALLRQNRWVVHTYEVLGQLGGMLDLAQDAEGGMRAYALTGREELLQPYHAALEEFPTRVQTLRREVSDNPGQVAATDRLATLLKRRLDSAHERVEARRTGGLEGVLPLMNGSGKRTMDEVRQQIAAMRKVETDLLDLRTRESHASARRLQSAFGVLMASALLLLGVFGVLVRSDLAGRRRAAARLEANERRFRALLESAPDAMILANAAGEVTLVNTAFERLFGLGRDAAVGRPLESFLVARAPGSPTAARPADDGSASTVAPDLVSSSPAAASRALPAAESVLPPVGFEGVRQNGTRFPAEVTFSPLALPGTDGEAASTQSLAAVRDRTEREQAEDKLRRFSEDLARSNAELERFAYVASHDLQEPLRMVSSYTQLLGRRYRGKLDASADEFIAYAVDGATRMQTLINDLLVYSRVGAKSREFAPVDCEALVERVLHDLGPALEAKGATVHRDPLPTVSGDAVQLGQLFQNLLVNATKFSRPEVPPRVEITAHQRSKQWWRFSVKDNGIGIEPQYFERIFVLFQRLHGKQEYPGTGMGLAICKKIVERHGGRLWLESKPGEGANFLFTLPASGE